MGSSHDDFNQRKTSLARKILTDFNNAFQSVIEDYTHTLPPQKNSNHQKMMFKQQFVIVADELNLACNKIHTEEKNINPRPFIKSVQDLITQFEQYPARNNHSTSRLFTCCRRNNSFGQLFRERIEKYYDYLLEMIKYTCDDFSEHQLQHVEVKGVFDFMTDNSINQYRKHAMQDRLLKSSFQARETMIIENDTISAMRQINPEIPEIKHRIRHKT
jgi:hypothetical protein